MTMSYIIEQVFTTTMIMSYIIEQLLGLGKSNRNRRPAFALISSKDFFIIEMGLLFFTWWTEVYFHQSNN